MSDTKEYSLRTAQEAAERDALGAWVAGFLSSPGSDNAVLANQLPERLRWWLGPVRVPLDQLQRLAGPADAPVLCQVDEDYWGDNVDKMEQRIEDGWQPPPVILSYRDAGLVLEDGNHRVESLRRSGARDAWAVIGFEDPEERRRFELRGEASTHDA